MENKRIIALDVGSKRIGIAMTDILGLIASPYESYVRKNFNADLEYIKNLILEKDAVKVICGLPVSLDGKENTQSQYTREFAGKLKNLINVPLEFFDERFTTKTAESALIEFEVRRDKRKNLIDKIAASIILQNYLNTIYKGGK